MNDPKRPIVKNPDDLWVRMSKVNNNTINVRKNSIASVGGVKY